MLLLNGKLMTTYVAHYKSLDSDTQRAKGLFEFESAARLNTKANMHDARVCMLENFGNEALSWTIDKIEKKSAKEEKVDGQLELDFRAPKKQTRKRARQYW
jgi:hypothetical protein